MVLVLVNGGGGGSGSGNWDQGEREGEEKGKIVFRDLFEGIKGTLYFLFPQLSNKH